ncbi:zinc ABC transporter substrate-binding protein [Jannaschia ovalis]|uniref:High-affinity zinc uptake system protein ZnuA n=1 Tax=Jannaschia ovalis TaxID=3038773 RepID=A0ABY8L7Y4_9RHOB|nr:zinc ABC transporter substrate-binding protein [Jannaschia sp. GRR-S6-38]WGH77487.1 zinc ABC transporter substrate-binding protein [Jannaschia sp. GRR-S6-38]
MMILRALPFLALATPAWAEIPLVATDIAPVRSLVAQAMSGLGEPEQVLPPGGSPHDFALRPSQARALSRADAVIWIGPELTPGLAEAVSALGEGASLPLLSVPGTILPQLAEGEAHGHHGDDHDDHAETHDDHGDDHEDHEDHAEAHGHDHGDFDPHAWLDPENGKLWLDAIAALLGALDPGNAATYAANAAAGRLEIDAAAARAAALLEPVSDRAFLLRHDAYRAFVDHFDLASAGAIAASDATEAGAARLSELRAAARSGEVVCVFNEAGESDAPVRTVIEGTPARSATLDPLGTRLEPGPALYPRLIETLARDIAACLDG